MKTNSLKKASLIVAVFVSMSCADSSPTQSETDTEPLIELEFSTSPINLQGVDAQFAEDIPYDQHENTVFDVFLPNSSTPTGMAIFIHGGGFTGGDKAFIYTSDFPTEVVELLSNNVAVATINYRLLEIGDTEGVLKSLNDSRRALQYIRYIHEELNIDKNKIALFGTSAGASTSMWLATNDDFKDEANADPVLRESTRVLGIGLRATQSSLDIESRWVNDVFSDFGTSWNDLRAAFGDASIFSFYGVSTLAEYESVEIDEYRNRVDMLSLLSSDDPEIWVQNTGTPNGTPLSTGNFNHHPFHAREIKERADAVGVPNVAAYGNPELINNLNNETYVQFLIRKINQ